ncbi:uncharacterized protein O3C94_001919 [Discoglossus pictus]
MFATYHPGSRLGGPHYAVKYGCIWQCHVVSATLYEGCFNGEMTELRTHGPSKKLQELERINKAIEAVKNEVEEKQKKLLLYKNGTQDIKKCPVPTIDSNSNMTSCLKDDEAYTEVLKRTSLTTASSSKKRTNSMYNKKYVIDRSCPATDLEYDPLLNYSAGLLGSTKKESESSPKSKRLKCDENSEDTLKKKPRAVSPIRLEIKLQESDDDDVLVIDAPPIEPISKKQRVNKFQDGEDEVQENKENDFISSTLVKIDSLVTEKNINESNNVVERESTPVPLSPKAGSFNSIDCKLSERQISEPASYDMALTEANNISASSELPEPKETIPQNENEVSVQCRQNIQELTQLEESVIQNSDCQINDLPLDYMCLKETQHFLSNVQNVETVVNHLPTNLLNFDQCVTEVPAELENPIQEQKSQQEVFISENKNDIIVVDSSSEATEDSEVDIDISDSDDPMEECLRIFNEFVEMLVRRTGFTAVFICVLLVGEIDIPFRTSLAFFIKLVGQAYEIIPASSSVTIKESEPHNHLTMVEGSLRPPNQDRRQHQMGYPKPDCIHLSKKEVFLPDNLNREIPVSITHQTCQDQSEVCLTETKRSDKVTGQKKRIARPSASDVKSSTSVLVPYRGPAPQQIPHARILHVQQQAVQITAAVKSGQAFVASTQKKVTGCVSPAFHNFGQLVCLNLVEVQPVIPIRNQFSGFYQGNSHATSTLKASMPPKRTLQTAPVKISGRKRSLAVVETGVKVPHETRQRYVNSFVEEFLKDSTTVQEAFVKAQMEEKAIYERCGSKNMYLNIAVNSLKKLRDQRNMTLTSTQQSSSRENISGPKKTDGKYELSGIRLYKNLKEYLLSDEQLQENGFPRPNPEKPGSALLHHMPTKTAVNDVLRRVCCRCGEIYSVTLLGKHVRKEECTFHSGKVLRHKVPGGIETRYSCCEAAVGTPGCQVSKLHVHDGQKENLDGFVKTFIKLQPSDGNPGVFSLDCEMCYTTHGLELTRVTVVDPSLQVVYDTFVKPDNEILDYNTRFSGVTEDNLVNVTTSIRDVQAIMLNLFSADTILIGHSLENDLIALKLLHDTVVDTSVVFPHRLGLPHRRALRNLMADYLRRIIQDNVGGHDSSEDAAACMELMLWKVKEDTKGRR